MRHGKVVQPLPRNDWQPHDRVIYNTGEKKQNNEKSDREAYIKASIKTYKNKKTERYH